MRLYSRVLIITIVAIGLLLGLVIPTGKAEAATYTAATSGDWTNSATWGVGSGYPVAGDTVTISGSRTVTVNTAGLACATLNLGTASSGTATLSFASGSDLTVSGTFTIGGSTGRYGKIDMTGGGTLNLGGTVTVTRPALTNPWLPGSGTVNYGRNDGLNQNLAYSSSYATFMNTYNNLTISGQYSKTIPAGASITVNGVLSREGTATLVKTGSLAYGNSATLQYKGSGGQTTGPEFFASFSGSALGGGIKVENASGVYLNAAKDIGSRPLYIGSSVSNSKFNDAGFQLTATGTLNMADGSTFKLGQSSGSGTALPAFGTLNLADGTTIEYGSGSAQTVSAVTYKNLTFSNSGTKTPASGTLNVQGTFYNNASTFTAGSGSTVVFNGSAAQAINGTGLHSTTFYNLTIDNAAGITLNTDITVSNTLTLTNGTFTIGGSDNTLTLNGPAIAGTPTNLSTTSTSNLVFGGSSTGVNIPSSVTALKNLTVNNTNGITLNSSPAISGTLYLTNGKINTGSNTLILNNGAAVSRTSGWVNGNLQKYIPSAGTYAFEIGGDYYDEVGLNFSSIGGAGTLTVSAATAQHPNLNSSDINPAKYVGAYWTFTSGITSPSYSATFNFDNSDKVGSPDISIFIVGKYNGGTWTYPTVGTVTSNSIQVTGLTSFSDFAAGERTYKVTYNGNGNDSGSVPTDNTKYAKNATVTVLGNTGGLAKTGYAFNGWNTAANGSGTPYAPSATFSILADTTLYAQWESTYTVTYNGNGSTGGTAPTDGSSPYIANALVTVLGNTGSLVKTGYTFNNWNTAADGTGTSYAPDSTFNINTNTTLYARWTINTYTMTYDANSGSGAPNDTNSPYDYNTSVTVLGAGSMTRTGYTFNTWNTASDGSGTTRTPGSSFNIDADTTLYAQWTINTYTVTYNANGGTGTQTDPGSPYNYNTSVTVLGTGSIARTGYTFNNWNTAANGSGTSYDPSDTFSIVANTTLYAQWTINTYTMTYNGNGNTGGSAPADGSSPYNHNSTVTVLGAGSLVKTGYAFNGWNTAANGSGTSYAPSATFSILADTTLYAQWTIITYTMTYDANGGSGAPTDPGSPYNYNATVTVLGAGSMTRTGYTFNNWNTAANGSGTSYSAGNTFSITSNTVLYAQWTINTYTVNYNGNGNDSGSAPTDPSSPYNYNSTVTVLGNSGGLAKAGYTFNNWNTAANGSGTSYAPGNTFSVTANTVLYAQWSSGTFTVTYNGNGNTSGSAPTDGSSPYVYNATVTVLGNTGGLAKTGYTFNSWNTAANGSGITYFPSDTFSILTSTTLYAQWTVDTYTVTYNGNGSTGGSIPVDGSSPYSYSSLVTVLANVNGLTKTGYSFNGWNTAANGSGTGYAPGNTFSIAGNTVLYAQWTAAGSYNITVNGDTGGTVKVAGVTVSLPHTATVASGNNLLVEFFAVDHVTNVMVDGVTQGAPTSYNFTNVTANHNLYVSFYTTVVNSTTGPVPVPAGSGNVVDASATAQTIITVSTTGPVNITVMQYAGNPHPESSLPSNTVQKFNDVIVSDLNAVTWPMYVEIHYTDGEIAGITESSLRMYYYQGASWHLCSSTGVNETGNFVWANLTASEVLGSPLMMSGDPFGGPPVMVGGFVMPVNKIQVLLPYLCAAVVIALLLAGGGLKLASRRRSIR